MHVFKAAQPALLYLVPACLGTPLLVAVTKGELVDLLKYVPTVYADKFKEFDVYSVRVRYMIKLF